MQKLGEYFHSYVLTPTCVLLGTSTSQARQRREQRAEHMNMHDNLVVACSPTHFIT